MSIRYLVLPVLGFSLVVAIVVAGFVQPAPAPLPQLGSVSEFTLTDSNANTFQSKSLHGSVWVANFFFTSCRGICPTIMGEMEKVQRHFTGNDGINFVSVTVDPATDTPAVLATYKSNFSTADEGWHFLTGPAETVRAVSETAFKLAAGKQPAAHSRRVVLIDRHGEIRGFYDGTEKDVAQKIIHDTLSLVTSGGE